MVSQTVEYALRAMVHLAHVAPQICRTRELAAATKTPAPYLSKVLQCLSRAGLVQLRRGIGGGAALVSEPTEITILDVVNAVDPIRRIDACPLGLESHSATLCPLHRRLDAAMADVETAFRDTTLADLLHEPGGVAPLCKHTQIDAPNDQQRDKQIVDLSTC